MTVSLSLSLVTFILGQMSLATDVSNPVNSLLSSRVMATRLLSVLWRTSCLFTVSKGAGPGQHSQEPSINRP